MRRLATLFATSLALLAATLTPTGAGASPGHTVETLHFSVAVDDGARTCSIIGDLYLPTTASADNRVPAVLTTNGFGGSKDDQAAWGAALASEGYAVLSYSGLGFGGSGCKITLDDPATDGQAAQHLVSYLAGETGIAFTDAARTVEAPALDVVQLDGPGDPRVGMVGGSYGGSVQYAAASLDERIDALVPLITWHDLSYSLAPNNLVPSATQRATPGAAKLVWALGFTGLGIVDGLRNYPADTKRLVGCPNFADFVCPAVVAAGVSGHTEPWIVRELQKRSIVSYGSTVTAPTLIIQGQSDTLFNLNESTSTYRALEAQGTETKLIWANGGHSGPWAPGELDLTSSDLRASYIGGRILDWFDHHLRDAAVDTGPEFAYFREWVSYDGVATPAYGTSPTVDVGTPQRLVLSGSQLVPEGAPVARSTAKLLAGAAGLPTSIDPVDVLGSFFGEAGSLPEIDLPGTAASYTSAPLGSHLDVVGAPTLDLKVSSPTSAVTQLLGTTGQLVLFVKLAEVDPDGTATIVRNLVAPVRVPNVNAAFTVRLPAISHRFDAGHRLRLIVSGGSVNYRGGLTPTTVSITTGSTGNALTLPTLP